METLPDHLVLDFLHPAGTPITYGELNDEFLKINGIGPDRRRDPFRVAIKRKSSKAGNAFYEYSQNGISLPEGLDTFLRIEGVVVPFGRPHKSKNGHPTREGKTQIMVGGMVYLIAAYLTQSKNPYYIKIVAHKKPSGNSSAQAQMKPRGGVIL